MDDLQTNNKTDIIDLGAGGIELCVNNTIFRTHKYKLSKFSILMDLIQRACYLDRPRYMPKISVQREICGAEDFSNTFKVLYASVVKGPPTFDAPVLISALRISSAYDYPALRAFSIAHLEGLPLSAIQRIELAREFQLTSWEGPAYNELYTREEAITRAEARILGSDAFSVVAEMREENLRREQAVLREAAAQARREFDEQANRVARERGKERREANARWEAAQKALGGAEKANRETLSRVKREAEEQANRVALERDRREAEAIQRALVEVEKANRRAAKQAKREADEKAIRVAAERNKRETEAIKEAVRVAQAQMKKKVQEQLDKSTSWWTPSPTIDWGVEQAGNEI
ncbi:hypothetical protein BDV93DRAFT_605680 [Ceratobasidium sp. AG-I]|nr:hypothetical protein BDV93DRAFT_605680 [Ceratobasidium sp. AG-I]